MSIKLTDCKEITATQLYALSDSPVYKGQTAVKDNIYHTVWSINGKLFKVKNQLLPAELL